MSRDRESVSKWCISTWEVVLTGSMYDSRTGRGGGCNVHQASPELSIVSILLRATGNPHVPCASSIIQCTEQSRDAYIGNWRKLTNQQARRYEQLDSGGYV